MNIILRNAKIAYKALRNGGLKEFWPAFLFYRLRSIIPYSRAEEKIALFVEKRVKAANQYDNVVSQILLQESQQPFCDKINNQVAFRTRHVYMDRSGLIRTNSYIPPEE